MRTEPESLSGVLTGSPGDAMRSRLSENSIWPRAVPERARVAAPVVAPVVALVVARVIVVKSARTPDSGRAPGVLTYEVWFSYGVCLTYGVSKPAGGTPGRLKEPGSGGLMRIKGGIGVGILLGGKRCEGRPKFLELSYFPYALVFSNPAANPKWTGWTRFGDIGGHSQNAYVVESTVASRAEPGRSEIGKWSK